MKKAVVKFGGSNLKAPQDILKIMKALALYDSPVIVVVSAFRGVTDILAGSAKRVAGSRGAIDRIITEISEPYLKTVECVAACGQVRREIKGKIERRVGQLRKYLHGISLMEKTPDFADEMIISFGERLSSVLLESILKRSGYRCVEKLPEDIGFITDGEYGNATLDFTASEATVRRELSGDITCIVPGFYGVSSEGRITTTGRGGSDYTASALARCIGASSVDYWKDVPGFLTADPSIVGSPEVIEKLSYREAAELSYFGARILHPRFFEPLHGTGIPIRLFDINSVPAKLEPSTLIDCFSREKVDVVKSVTYNDEVGILGLHGPGVGIKPGIMALVASALGDARINIKSIITSQTAINIFLLLDDLEKGRNIVRGLRLKAVERISGSKGVSLIAAVGEGMFKKPGVGARILGAVSDSGINVRIMSAGASDVAIYLIISRRDRSAAVKAIHREFFERKDWMTGSVDRMKKNNIFQLARPDRIC